MSWQALNLAALEFSTRTPAPEYAELLYRRRRHYVTGPPESLKTVFAWAVARSIVREHGELVACIDFEMGPNASRELLEDLGWTLDEIESIYYVEPDGPPETSDIDSIVSAGVTLAIIDSAPGAFNVSGLDDNQRKDAEKFAQAWVEPLYRREVATLVIDHVVKNVGNRGGFAIGSERKIGGADVHLGLETVRTLTRGGEGLVKVHVHKDRPGWLRRPYVAEFALRSHPETHKITWEFREPVTVVAGDGGWQPTILMEKVSWFLEGQTEPVSRNRVESANLGKRAEHIRLAMDALIAEGYVHEQRTGKARLLTSIKPYRTSSDLVPTSSDELPSTSSHSSPAYRRDEDGDEPEDAGPPDHLEEHVAIGAFDEAAT